VAGEPDIVDLHLIATAEASGVASVKLLLANKKRQKKLPFLHDEF
jgi:hypothetical protein